jgi:hypothetical protein
MSFFSKLMKIGSLASALPGLRFQLHLAARRNERLSLNKYVGVFAPGLSRIEAHGHICA